MSLNNAINLNRLELISWVGGRDHSKNWYHIVSVLSTELLLQDLVLFWDIPISWVGGQDQSKNWYHILSVLSTELLLRDLVLFWDIPRPQWKQ